MNKQIKKRDGHIEKFEKRKIKSAIRRAFISQSQKVSSAHLDTLVSRVTEDVEKLTDEVVDVEQIQDIIETILMQSDAPNVAKSFILYRSKRAEYRKTIDKFAETIAEPTFISLLKDIQAYFTDAQYSLELLFGKYKSFYKEGANPIDLLIKGATELVTAESPDWEFIAARFYLHRLHNNINGFWATVGISSFYGKIQWMVDQNLYGSYMLERWSKDEIDELEKYIDSTRDLLFTYSSIELLSKRYLICTRDHVVIETPQEMFMGIAMHMASNETNKVAHAKNFYTILSKLQITVATPTLSNSRKPIPQLSSCFIDTMPDNLTGIYRTVTNFAQVSKLGGGMGIYAGKVRAIGSDIRGFKGVAGGVIKWVKICNDTAVAVDQLGVRQGSVAIYLDIWHRDILEFLQIRTNNGDDRMKAHDVFPGICIPDYFWKLAKTNMDADWHMMCPHEIQTQMGYYLEDYWGEEWERRYNACVQNSKIPKRTVKIKDIVRIIIKSAVETGTPFIFNRDTVNRMNPNNHCGVIYCSNLCTEIAQNQSEIKERSCNYYHEAGKNYVEEITEAGDFVVCNLASLVLGNIDVNSSEELRFVVSNAVRMLDNVIDLNHYPIHYAKITNKKMRPIGLGTSGYHHLLAKTGIKWESEEHLKFMDEVYERINFYAIEASVALAKEKSSYQEFKGSDWETGAYFAKRNYNKPEWERLRFEAKNGIRNGYIMAIAPTSSTSIIAGTTAGTDPVMNKFFLEEKKGSIIPRVAPELSDKTYWLYKNAHNIDQEWVIDAAAIRQRHIDQAQSVNLFITHDYTFRRILDLYIRAWERGVKTIYYIRSRSLEVEECETCAS